MKQRISAGMRDASEWHQVLAADMQLPEAAATELREQGFTIVPGPELPGGHDQYSVAFDKAVREADPADVSVRSSTRINDFVNRGAEFDGIYTFAPLLGACVAVIGKPFKLSGMRARILEPGAPVEALHVDVKQGAKDWPLLGAIFMIDAFTSDNGATRFVPGSHLRAADPRDCMASAVDAHEEQVLACGSAGSLIIFNASVWHGHSANRSQGRRRSIQAHFVARDAQESTHHAGRMREETLLRLGPLARYVLDV
jgi:hypothetical protein